MFSELFFLWSSLIGVVLFSIYKWATSTHSFFLQKRIPHNKPIPFVGNSGQVVMRKTSIYDLLSSAYNQFSNNNFFGFYEFKNPMLVICTPELIKQIIVKDFDHFINHRLVLPNQENEVLFDKSLAALRGHKWRFMRSTLTPAFSSNKMKQMFQMIVQCTEQTIKVLLKEATEMNEPYVPEMYDIFSRYTNDIIATTAFGIEVNSLKNRNNEFYTRGQTVTRFGLVSLVKLIFMSVLPWAAKLFNIKFFNKDITNFFHSLVHDTIEYREKNEIIRPDLINLLMKRKKENLNNKENSVIDDVSTPILDDDDLTAQCFLFFFAGFETSSTLMCYAAHELTENPHIQQKVIAEIDEVRKELKGTPLTFEVLQSMTYLDMVISETLRKWPPLMALDRLCTKKYTIENKYGQKHVINEGDIIWIPVYPIHRDPQYYPDPLKFDPERFNDNNDTYIQPYTYIPFGAGPRNCIGARFAVMESKLALYYFLTNFTFEISEKTEIPLKLSKTARFSRKPTNGFHIHLKPRINI